MRRHVGLVMLAGALIFMVIRARAQQPPRSEPGPATPTADSATDREQQELQQFSQQFVEAFNSGKVASVMDFFLPQSELTDEEGQIWKGADQIKELLTRYFAAFPEPKMNVRVESLRPLGSILAIEEGEQTVTTKDGRKATNRLTMIHVLRDGKWRIASVRIDADDPDPTPHDRLQDLAWLVGEWVGEGREGVLRMNCHWSEDGNFLLTDYHVEREGKESLHSTQRLGWDPLSNRVRSWVFDSDGGYGNAFWTPAENHWIVKSTAVLPDGTTGSATMNITPQGDDKFVLRGSDRVVGNAVAADFELTLVRRPPEPNK